MLGEKSNQNIPNHEWQKDLNLPTILWLLFSIGMGLVTFLAMKSCTIVRVSLLD